MLGRNTDVAKWIKVCRRDEVPAGDKVCAAAAENGVVLCDSAGRLHAVANVCPHAGLPIGEGDLHGRVLICPFHGYAYDIHTGRNIDFPHEEPGVRTYPVKIEQGCVWVDLEADVRAEAME